MKHLLLLVGFLVAMPVMSAGYMQPPKLPDPQRSGEPLEPEVNIIETDRGVEHRYMVNGQLRAVKVVPRVGAPYYLLDTDGDGELDARDDDPRSIGTHMWELVRF